MQSGFNTNFRYRGVLFHVQTEDSGLENPHVIRHLFHGGNIMASEKRDYSELLAEHAGESLEGAIRKLMEGQHKSMLKQLSRGEHDSAIEQRMGVGVFQVETGSEASDPQPITEEERPPRTSPAPAVASASSASASTPTPAQAEPTRLDNSRPVAEETQPVVSRLSRVFGERVAAEKPLDEMVLDYLVENARNKRKRTGK